MKTPFPWFGGKTTKARWILDHLPGHHAYIELYGGSGAVLFAKPRSPVEVYNDLDGGLVHFYRTLQDPAQLESLIDRLSRVIYSRQLYNEYRRSWEVEEDPVERAAQWYYVARASFSGNFGASWSWSVTGRNYNEPARQWMVALQTLPEWHHRLQGVAIEQAPALGIIKNYDRPTTCFYADPPYVPETRKAGKYRYEMDLDDHRQLVATLLAVKGSVVLSGYDHPVYAPLEAAGWSKATKEVYLTAHNRLNAPNQMGKECLWIHTANEIK